MFDGIYDGGLFTVTSPVEKELNGVNVEDGEVQLAGTLNQSTVRVSASGELEFTKNSNVSGSLFVGGYSYSSTLQLWYFASIIIDSGAKLTVSGSASFSDGYSAGLVEGSMLTTGSTTVNNTAGSFPGLYLDGADTSWTNTGTVTDLGVIGLGYSSYGTYSIINKAGAVFDLAGSNGGVEYGDVTHGSSFSNAGTLLVAAGSSNEIDTEFQNTGLISLGTGAYLVLRGSGSLGGTVSGGGYVVFDGIYDGSLFTVTTPVEKELNGVTVEGGEVQLAGALNQSTVSVSAYGELEFTQNSNVSSSLFVGGYSASIIIDSGAKLTVSGSASFGDGQYAGVVEGSVLTTGSTTVNSSDGSFAGLYLDGANTTWTNTGTVTDLGVIGLGYIGPGYTSNGTYSIINKSGAVFNLAGSNGGVEYADTTQGSTFTNAGNLLASGDTETVSIALINTGLVETTSGTMNFIGAITNNGTIDAATGSVTSSKEILGRGSLQIGGTGTLSLMTGTDATQKVDFLATTGVLDLTNPNTFLGSIVGFGGSDSIDLVNTAETKFSYGNGVLKVSDGTNTVATLHFSGNYTKQDFLLGSDGQNGTVITFV